MLRLLFAGLLMVLPASAAISVTLDRPDLPADPCNTPGDHLAFITCLAPDFPPLDPSTDGPERPVPPGPIIDLGCDTPGLLGCPGLPGEPAPQPERDPAAVPAPPALALLAVALAWLGAIRRRRGAAGTWS